MDKVVTAGCGLLLAQGILIGLGLGVDEGVARAVKSGLEMTGYLGGAVTAVIAWRALTGWREQVRHTARYQAMVQLRGALEGLRVFPEHLSIARRCLLAKLRSGGDKNQILEDMKVESDATWRRAMERYSVAWHGSKHFIAKAEDFPGAAGTLYDQFISMDFEHVAMYSNSLSELDHLPFAIESRQKIKETRAYLEDLGKQIDELLAEVV
ncbi:hypothetical protein [Stutzerimonas xanthomarina]|nr:hypothetical protein [Stutzerimonas xanthomarina]MCP9337607.1 hypothetical protein [Stutzerimonas xanthomarina]